MPRRPKDYPYKGIPFTQHVARELIPEALAEAPMRRKDIVSATSSTHEQCGGVGTANPEAVVKKALADLMRDGLIESPMYSYYSLVKRKA